MNFDLIKHNVAAAVRAEIARAGLTHQEVADAIGIAKATFSRKVNGENPFSVVDVMLIAAYLNVELATIMRMPSAVQAGAAA